MHTLVIHSQKGGSGRSTLAVNLAVEADKAGRRVILFDIDHSAAPRRVSIDVMLRHRWCRA